MSTWKILEGDCLASLRTLPDESVHCCVTSPPYWGLRDYGHAGQIGLEETPEAYVAKMVDVFREVRRVLRADGTCWLNLGDSYASGKQLVGIPWRVAFALQADGWWLRQDIIWAKPNPMPESVTDRCTKAHEYVFLLAKSERYFYDQEAVKEAAKGPSGSYFGSSEQAGTLRKDVGRECQTQWATRNRRSVWTVTTKPYKGAHFATMPPALVEPCIKAGCPASCCAACGAPLVREVERVSEGKSYSTGKSAEKNAKGLATGFSGYDDGSSAPVFRTIGFRASCDCAAGTKPGTVLDPFAGSGTTLAVALSLGRSAIGCELNPEYIRLAEQRIAPIVAQPSLFDEVPA